MDMIVNKHEKELLPLPDSLDSGHCYCRSADIIPCKHNPLSVIAHAICIFFYY